MINVTLQFFGLDLFNIKFSAKFYQNIPNSLRVKFQFFFFFCFLFFRIWTSAKPRPIPNVIWQSHGLNHVNTNVYAKFHHNIPLILRDRVIFTFSEFGARQNLADENDISQSLGLDLVNVNVYADVYQNIPLSSRDKVIFTFQDLALGKASTDDKCHFAIVTLFFRIWTSAKTQPISNVIWQSHGIHLVNVNLYAKFHHYSTQFKR